jgi:hypothetical protein
MREKNSSTTESRRGTNARRHFRLNQFQIWALSLGTLLAISKALFDSGFSLKNFDFVWFLIYWITGVLGCFVVARLLARAELERQKGKRL